MSTDLVSNLLSSLRNAYKARLQTVTLPYGRLLADICDVLARLKQQAARPVAASARVKQDEVAPHGVPPQLSLQASSVPPQASYTYRS